MTRNLDTTKKNMSISSNPEVTYSAKSKYCLKFFVIFNDLWIYIDPEHHSSLNNHRVSAYENTATVSMLK